MWTQLFWPHNVAASAMNRMADSSWRAFGARGSRTSRKIDNTGCIEGLPNQETPQNQLSSRWQQPLFTNAIPPPAAAVRPVPDLVGRTAVSPTREEIVVEGGGRRIRSLVLLPDGPGRGRAPRLLM